MGIKRPNNAKTPLSGEPHNQIYNLRNRLNGESGDSVDIENIELAVENHENDSRGGGRGGGRGSSRN